MKEYKKLDVWIKSHGFCMHVKKIIGSRFPKEEPYNLTSQLSRSALSIPLNIAEDCERYTDEDFINFLNNSPKSTNEADYCCFAAFELNYISQNEYNIVNKQVNEVRAMLIAFIKFFKK